MAELAVSDPAPAAKTTADEKVRAFKVAPPRNPQYRPTASRKHLKGRLL